MKLLLNIFLTVLLVGRALAQTPPPPEDNFAPGPGADPTEVPIDMHWMFLAVIGVLMAGYFMYKKYYRLNRI